MVLAAGLGTRLRPFTDRIPKPLIPLHGIPCIEYALRALENVGVREVAVNLHAHPEQMRGYLAARPAGGARILPGDETALLLGSAGGIRNLFDLLGEGPVFSMNADVLHAAPLSALQERHRVLRASQGVWMTLVLASGAALEGAEGAYREIQTDPNSGLIVGFGVKKTGVPFFTGTAVWERAAFAHLEPGCPAEFVPEVLEPAIRAGKVGFFHSDALWLDIGSPALWWSAEVRIREALIRGGLPPELEKMLRASDPTLQGRFELGKSSLRLDDMLYEIENLRGCPG